MFFLCVRVDSPAHCESPGSVPQVRLLPPHHVMLPVRRHLTASNSEHDNAMVYRRDGCAIDAWPNAAYGRSAETTPCSTANLNRSASVCSDSLRIAAHFC